ncbi:hypothetical protein PG990_007253 [Apiospora arundinis]
MATVDTQAKDQWAEKVDTTTSEHNAARDTNVAIDNEHNMTLRQSFRFWWKAVVFSFIISLCVIMEGYDTSLMNNFFPFPAFKNKFGDEVDPDGGMLVSSRWQTIILNGTQVGCIIGLFINGYISEWLGYKKTMIATMVFMIGAIFIPFFSTGLEMFLAGGIIQGLPWGIFQTLSISYAADLCPTHLRAYMTSWVNMCWVIGGLLSTGILRGLFNIQGEWGYKIPFALQWVWPIPIIVATLLCPESPWWLVRQGRITEAKDAVRKLISPKPDIEFDLDAHVEMIVITNKFEEEMNSGTNYWHLFKGSNLRRTEVSAMAFITQAFCGVPFMGYGIQFMINANLDPSNSFNLGVVQNSISLIGCILAWYTMARFGRRTLYLSGLSAIVVVLTIVGCLGLAPERNKDASWAVGSLIIIMLFAFQLTLGPICYSIAAEIPSTRLRIKTVALSRASYNTAVFVNNAIMPKMVGKNDWNWGAKGGFLWAGVAFVFLVWSWFRLPESWGLTYSELDLLFEHGAGAREFSREKAEMLKPALTDVALKHQKQAGSHHVETTI